MCGIIGIASNTAFSATELLARLKRLEYRGYDSYGYASQGAGRKEIGKVALVEEDGIIQMRSGIAHTRWATHGGVTRQNAHPHTVGKVTLVHNGIIENYEELGEEDEFLSETDSERLAAAIDRELEKSKPIDAIRRALAKASGTWALALLIEGEEGVFIARNKAPLLIGMLENAHIASSDARGLADATKILSLNDGSVAHMLHDNIAVIDADGSFATLHWEENMLEKPAARGDGYAMEHEILETPARLRGLQQYWESVKQSVEYMLGTDSITIIGCGSSFNAGLMAKALSGRKDIEVQLASDADIRTKAVIAVSQSGETADILDAVEKAKANGATVIAVVNTPHSTLTRLAHNTILLNAGEERCVAATKSFTLQSVLIAAMLGKDLFAQAAIATETAIGERAAILKIADRIKDSDHVFIIGRGAYYSLACEFALKLKEISYQHAEAVPALELKHGPLALITQDTPVLVVGDASDARLISTMHEVAARNGMVIPWYLTNCDSDIITAVVTGQILTFEVAKLRETPIDMPRNLAKSVTVF